MRRVPDASERGRAAAGLFACALAGGLAFGCSRPAAPPNLILIIVDTLRADQLGVYGGPEGVSPEIDGLAAGGIRFARVIAPCTWTRPSIGAMLTSRHPRALGLYEESQEMLADRFPTLAEALRARGYATLGVTANPNINSYFGFDRGFDAYADTDVAFGFMPAAGDEALWLERTLPTARQVLRALLGRARALRRSGDRRPVYLQANLMDVHQALDARMSFAPFEDTFGGDRVLQAVRKVSAEIGSFLAEIAKLPGFEDTVVVVTSDHGETYGDHPSLAEPKWHGHLVYETQALVPLVVHRSARRLGEPRVVERTVSLLDLAPTLVELAGAPPLAGAEGRSLAALLEDPGAPVELPATHVVETRFRSADKIAIYGEDFAYVVNRDGQAGTKPVELQRNRAAADGASTDLAAERPGEAESLAGALASWERSHPSEPPTLNPERPSERQLDQLRAIGYIR
jgi:arylsulfatase A-like enzyme